MINLDRACAKYRAPQYTRTFFILLSAGSPDLPLDKASTFIAREYEKVEEEASSETDKGISAVSDDDDMVDHEMASDAGVRQQPFQRSAIYAYLPYLYSLPISRKKPLQL
jgi:hypothetical protein